MGEIVRWTVILGVTVSCWEARDYDEPLGITTTTSASSGAREVDALRAERDQARNALAALDATCEGGRTRDALIVRAFSTLDAADLALASGADRSLEVFRDEVERQLRRFVGSTAPAERMQAGAKLEGSVTQLGAATRSAKRP